MIKYSKKTQQKIAKIKQMETHKKRFMGADGANPSANAKYKDYLAYTSRPEWRTKNPGKQPLGFKEFLAEAQRRGFLSADANTSTDASKPSTTTDTKKSAVTGTGIMAKLKEHKKLIIGGVLVLGAAYLIYHHMHGEKHKKATA